MENEKEVDFALKASIKAALEKVGLRTIKAGPFFGIGERAAKRPLWDQMWDQKAPTGDNR